MDSCRFLKNPLLILKTNIFIFLKYIYIIYYERIISQAKSIQIYGRQSKHF